VDQTPGAPGMTKRTWPRARCSSRQENLRRVDSARQDILKKVEEITGVKITDRDVPLLEILFLSDDETKTKLVEHLKSFQKAKQA
jgi:hypothetical protein